MLHVKVKTTAVRLSIPVPYVMLNMGISILSLPLVNKLISKWVQASMKGKEQLFTMPPLNKQELKRIVNELKKHKGLCLVHVKAKDGTEVVVKL